MEAIKIDNRSMGALYKFLVEKARKSPQLLDAKYRNITESNIVIAARDNGVLVQAFFIQIEDSIATTHTILGPYSKGTVKILDMLCAICASQTPEIVEHQFILAPSERYNFSECYKQCRLAKFTVDMIGGECITYKIVYPQP